MKLNDFATIDEAKAAGYRYYVDDENYAGDQPDIFKSVEEAIEAYQELYGEANVVIHSL